MILNTLLTIITILIILIIFVYLLNVHFGNNYTLKIFNKVSNFIKTSFRQKELINMSLIILWVIGGITMVLILSVMFVSPKNILQLMAAFTILLSAFLASVAMMKSISHSDEQKKIDKYNLTIQNIEVYVEKLIEECKPLQNTTLMYSEEYKKSLRNIDYLTSRIKFLMEEYSKIISLTDEKNEFPTLIKIKTKEYVKNSLNIQPLVKGANINTADSKTITYRDEILKRYNSIIDI